MLWVTIDRIEAAFENDLNTTCQGMRVEQQVEGAGQDRSMMHLMLGHGKREARWSVLNPDQGLDGGSCIYVHRVEGQEKEQMSIGQAVQ